MPKVIKDLAASVRTRLLQLSKEKALNFDVVLVHYASERLLYRLAQSRHADRFILKGAMLLMVWVDEPFRRTRDLDLLGRGDPTADVVVGVFKEILSQEKQDGITFDSDAIRIDLTQRNNAYGGLRMRTTADIAGARVPVCVDIGFGDAVEPPAQWIDYPVLLDMPAPRLRDYAPETAIAEKFQAIVDLGMTNSRMKDFYDLWIIVKACEIDQFRLIRAITATFERRNTAIPSEVPDGLSSEFATDPAKRQQWNSFKYDLGIDPGSLEQVVGTLAR